MSPIPAARRVGWGLVLAAVACALWWVKKDQSVRGSSAAQRAKQTNAASTATEALIALPAPGSAIEFDSLLRAARGDLAAFTEWLEKHLAALTPEQRTAFLRELMRRWTVEWRGADSGFAAAFRRFLSTAPQTAGKLVALLPSVPLRHLLVQELMRSWGARDPDSAERWIDTLREADDRSHALTALSEARLRSDPTAAMQWASARLQKAGDPGIVQDLTLGFAAADPKLAAHWTASLEAGAARDQATVTLATAWADRDAPTASQWAGSLAPSAARDDALTVVGQVWTSTAPEEAIRWFGTQTFTSPGARSLAFRDFSTALMDAEPEAAERWLGTIADPVAADAALTGAAEALYDESPERAAQTALKIQDPVSRTTALGDLMKQWREDDPEQAEKWAAEHLASSKSKAGQ